MIPGLLELIEDLRDNGWAVDSEILEIKAIRDGIQLIIGDLDQRNGFVTTRVGSSVISSFRFDAATGLTGDDVTRCVVMTELCVAVSKELGISPANPIRFRKGQLAWFTFMWDLSSPTVRILSQDTQAQAKIDPIMMTAGQIADEIREIIRP